MADIRARFAPTRERVCADEYTAQTRWLDAHRRVNELDATMKTETADLQTWIWAAWHHDLSQAQQAADVVDRGARRLGQRRRHVHAAIDELAAFAQRWQPVHRDLPTDPVELARQVRFVHGRRLAEQIDVYVTRRVVGAHPDADDVRQAERTASTRFDRAMKARIRLDTTLYNEIRPYGRAAHITNPCQRLTAITDQLAVVVHDLRTATTQVGRLEKETAIRALPAAGLDTEHGQWSADRAAQRQTAVRQAQERWRRQQQAYRTEPNQPGHPRLDHGPSIRR